MNFCLYYVFFVLTEESDAEFIFQSEEEEDFVGYDEELDENELSVTPPFVIYLNNKHIHQRIDFQIRISNHKREDCSFLMKKYK